jgi:hypothetical protein
MTFQGFVRCLPRVVVAGQTRAGRHGAGWTTLCSRKTPTAAAAWTKALKDRIITSAMRRPVLRVVMTTRHARSPTTQRSLKGKSALIEAACRMTSRRSEGLDNRLFDDGSVCCDPIKVKRAQIKCFVCAVHHQFRCATPHRGGLLQPVA